MFKVNDKVSVYENGVKTPMIGSVKEIRDNIMYVKPWIGGDESLTDALGLGVIAHNLDGIALTDKENDPEDGNSGFSVRPLEE